MAEYIGVCTVVIDLYINFLIIITMKGYYIIHNIVYVEQQDLAFKRKMKN